MPVVIYIYQVRIRVSLNGLPKLYVINFLLFTTKYSEILPVLYFVIVLYMPCGFEIQAEFVSSSLYHMCTNGVYYSSLSLTPSGTSVVGGCIGLSAMLAMPSSNIHISVQ